jgi:hypothetical protein
MFYDHCCAHSRLNGYNLENLFTWLKQRSKFTANPRNEGKGVLGCIINDGRILTWLHLINQKHTKSQRTMLAGENFLLVLADHHPGTFLMVPLWAGLAFHHFFLLFVGTATATVDGHILNLNWIPLGTSARTWKGRHTQIKETWQQVCSHLGLIIFPSSWIQSLTKCSSTGYCKQATVRSSILLWNRWPH